MRNKHTNKALKQGSTHFNTYMQGTTGYIQVKKGLNIFTVLKFICVICTILIITFHLFTKQGIPI